MGLKTVGNYVFKFIFIQCLQNITSSCIQFDWYLKIIIMNAIRITNITISFDDFLSSGVSVEWYGQSTIVWLPSRSSVLIYIYICIFYMSSIIGRIYTYNRSVIQYWWSCTPSHSIGLYFWGVRSSWVECHFLVSLVYQLCLALWW